MNFFNKLFNNNKNVNYQYCLSTYLQKNNITLDNLKKIFIISKSFITTENNKKLITIVGIIEKGNIKIGDTLYYIDENIQLRSLNVLGIRTFKQEISEAYKGDWIEITIDISTKLPQYLFLFSI